MEWKEKKRKNKFEEIWDWAHSTSHIIAYTYSFRMYVLTHQSACMHIIIMCSVFQCVCAYVYEWVNDKQPNHSKIYLFISFSFDFIFSSFLCFNISFSSLLSDESRTVSMPFFRSTNRPTEKEICQWFKYKTHWFIQSRLFGALNFMNLIYFSNPFSDTSNIILRRTKCKMEQKIQANMVDR